VFDYVKLRELTMIEEVINTSLEKEEKCRKGSCLFLNRCRKYLLNEFKRHAKGVKSTTV